jgi:hypothetical protein
MEMLKVLADLHGYMLLVANKKGVSVFASLLISLIRAIFCLRCLLINK